MEKKLIIFMPSIEGGGVEKNLFIISNYLSTQLKGITLITISKKYNHLFKNIEIINAKFNFWNNFIFIGFNISFEKWYLSDVTKFVKPEIFYSEDYHGLWNCVSNDKRNESRFEAKEYLVKKGDELKKNSPLFLIEAMKMESTVVAPFDGHIEEVLLEGNQMVHQDDLVVIIAQ